MIRRRRFRFRPSLLFACLLFALGVSPKAVAQPPDAETGSRHIRLLTVGNSFTRNATRFLDELVDAAGHRLTHRSLIIGGSPLELHARKAMAYETDPSDPESRYSGGESLQEALRSAPWDYVTIQQLSIKSHDVSTYQPYASELAELIRRDAPTAELLVHQTWAYRRDDPRFAAPVPRTAEDDTRTSAKQQPPTPEPRTQAEMYRGLSHAYRSITRQLGAKRIPVGDAFWIADSDPTYGYRVDRTFDHETAAHPDLPDQSRSLHVGWRWQKRNGEHQLTMDGHHANTAGEYLGACVWYEILFGESPVGLDFIPEGLEPQHAAFLQRTAHQAVTEARRPK